MTQLSISLPESASRFLEEQVASGRYQSASECVADLVENARVHAAKQQLSQLLGASLQSQEQMVVNDEYWARFDSRLKEEIERRQET